MRRLVLAFIATLGLAATTPLGVGADLGSLAQATISCNDSHSAILWVDQTTLSSLTADITSINTSGTGLTCAMTTDPSTGTSDWTVYDYNPSGQALAPRNSPDSMPATTTGSTTTFNFKSNIYTALLTTRDSALTGDLSMATLTDTIGLNGGATGFSYQNGDGCVPPAHANARFYFTSPSASGPSTGTPPAGFYTHFWWSNPVNVPLVSGIQAAVTISSDMSNPSMWSDWNGQNGANPAVTEAFIEATHNVQSVGLSFGGGCFFENGVTAEGNSNSSEQLSSNFSD
jgi:hypothetical protein